MDNKVRINMLSDDYFGSIFLYVYLSTGRK